MNILAVTSGDWPLPLVTVWWQQAIVLGVILAIMLTFSGGVVRYFVGSPATPDPTPRPFDAGAVIGKSENILVFLFILSGQFGGLALIIAAKTISRFESMKKDASYYLGGTLVNLVWSILLSMAGHLIAFGPFGSAD